MLTNPTMLITTLVVSERISFLRILWKQVAWFLSFLLWIVEKTNEVCQEDSNKIVIWSRLRFLTAKNEETFIYKRQASWPVMWKLTSCHLKTWLSTHPAFALDCVNQAPSPICAKWPSLFASTQFFSAAHTQDHFYCMTGRQWVWVSDWSAVAELRKSPPPQRAVDGHGVRLSPNPLQSFRLIMLLTLCRWIPPKNSGRLGLATANFYWVSNRPLQAEEEFMLPHLTTRQSLGKSKLDSPNITGTITQTGTITTYAAFLSLPALITAVQRNAIWKQNHQRYHWRDIDQQE